MAVINNQDLISLLIRQGTDGYYIPVYVKNISESLDEKVAMADGEEAKYLSELIDDDYIKNVNGILSINDMYGRLRDDIRYNNQSLTEDYTIPDNKNAMVVGPYTVEDGVNLTVGENSILKIL